MKNYLGVAILVFVALLFLPVTVEGVTDEDAEISEVYEKALVLEVENLNDAELGTGYVEQAVKVKILSGKFQGQTLQARNTLSGSRSWDIIVNPGDKVIVFISEIDGGPGEIYISDMSRTSWVRNTVIIFVIVLILIGGWKGIKALLALGLTILGIFYILLPLVMQGKSPIMATILVLSGVTCITMLIIAGFTRKALAATLGTIGGVCFAGILAVFIGKMAYLTGFASEESRMLLTLDNIQLSPEGLLFAGIIIGAVGATMDVAMSIASAVDEVAKANPGLSISGLIGAGMNVGRDTMGTMVNTLILAYTGEALPLLILFMSYHMPATRVFNSELIATEIIRAVIGSIGLILAVPITAVIAGLLKERFEGKADV